MRATKCTHELPVLLPPLHARSEVIIKLCVAHPLDAPCQPTSHLQVAAEANSARETYPDQSLYPVDSVPLLVQRINNVSRSIILDLCSVRQVCLMADRALCTRLVLGLGCHCWGGTLGTQFSSMAPCQHPICNLIPSDLTFFSFVCCVVLVSAGPAPRRPD
jgi:hypothetical protein